MLQRAALAGLVALGLIAGTARTALGPAGTGGEAVTASPTPEKVELPRADRDGWIPLFNGKDLKGWYGNPAIWRVENGTISGKIDKVDGNTFLIYNHPFADFELTADCMLIKGKGFTNSGIQYRSKVLDPKKWVVGGYQADMGGGYWGVLYEERGRGLLGKRLAGAKDPKYGEWAKYRIVAKGNHLEHYLNDVQSLDFVDTDEKKAAAEGIIALQYHAPGGFEVRFKDIRVKVFSSAGADAK